jgi:VanZ family protein
MRQASSSITPPWIHSTRLHVVIYGLLLVATPFILLQNYLVEFIASLSDSSLKLFGLTLKIIPIAALVLFIAAFIIYRSHITPRRILILISVILIDALAQQITDYYFNHRFYDLQQNWHYIAYGIFAYMAYRDLRKRRISLAKMMLVTYFCAFALSLSDEFIQMYLSSRVFDLCDTGKDVWGTMMGIVVIYGGGKYATSLFSNWREIRHKRFRQYLSHPFTLLCLIFLFTFLFLSISSILSETVYALTVALLTLGCFIILCAVLHLSQYRLGKYGLIIILVAGLLTQSFFYFKYRSANITTSQYGLTVYEGIPIVFFDIMIYPNGMFRLVDKKHYFNQRDREFFLKKGADIIIIGSGMDGLGGKGFPNESIFFLYNPFFKKGTQFIILKNPEACKTFNRLKQEKKNVLFILHNTC